MIIDFLSRGANEDFSNPVFYCLKKNGEKNKKNTFNSCYCINPQVNAFLGENIQQKGYVSGSVNASLGGGYAKLYLIRLKLLICCKIKDFSNANSEKNTIFLDLIPKKTRFFWI